jgi:diaminopimelate decarboxylase
MAPKSEHRKDLDKVKKRLNSSFFYYDLDRLKEHLTYMASVSDPWLKMWYACKANPLSAVLKIFRNLGFGVDIASIGELDQVLAAGIRPHDILSTGPAKSKEYLKKLLENEIDVIVLESFNQAYWLSELAAEMGVKPKALLRVQLPWSEGKSFLGGDDITPFGLSPDDWMGLDKDKIQNIQIVGFHVFQWGNLLDLDKLKRIWWRISEEVITLAKKLDITIEVMDLGGGLGVPYECGQHNIDFKDVVAILRDLREQFKFPKIWMELGRYAVADCGHYMTKIIDVKSVRGRDIIVTEGGINHIARPALVNQGFPCNLYRESSAPMKHFHVHGPLCTAIDRLGHFDLPEDVNVGDWLVFSQAGAYGFTEAMPFFLCHDLPAEVIIYNGDVVTPRTIKTSRDWLV